MRQYIVQEHDRAGQPTAKASPTDDLNFTVSPIVPQLSAHGFALLPGLTRWFDILNPLKHPEAWRALGNKGILETIRSHPEQYPRFFLNDSMGLDSAPQLSVDFSAKLEKSHLTVVEGGDAIATCPLLPSIVQSYLKLTNEFIANVREAFSDVLPAPSLPTVVKVRIFEYHASDPLAGMKPNGREAMVPHVDGSVGTLIIARSDGLLRFERRGQWHAAIHPTRRPFALVIPGVAAFHDYGLIPTPHMVLASSEHRISVTAFLTPALSADREIAEKQIARWTLRTEGISDAG